MEGLLGADELPDKVLAEINAIRERTELPALQNAFQEATNDSVYHASLVISSVSKDLELELAVLEAVRDLLNSESTSTRSLDPVMGPEQASNRRVLLDKFATHADVFINGQQGDEADDLSVRIEVYFKYLELPSVGPVIDGDLVVQGTSLHAEFGPAICSVEFAADHEETMVEAAVIAPWLMMFTPSASPEEQASEFAIPISLGVEQREGHVRVRIFVERAEAIPYGEDTEGYLAAFREDTQRERFVCALDFTTRATTGDGPAELGDDLGGRGSMVEGMGAMEGIEDAESIMDMDLMRAEAPARMRVPRRAAAVRGPPQPVVVDVKIAVGFDELEALRAEGFHLSCQHLHDEGVKSEDEEGRWPYFLVAKYADVAPGFAQPPAAAESNNDAMPQPPQDGEEIVGGGEGEVKEEDGGEGKSEGKEEEKGESEQGAAVEDMPAAATPDAPVSSEAFVVEDLMYLQVPREAATLPEGGDLAAALVLQGLLPEGYVLLPQDLLALGATVEEGSAASDMCIFVAFKLSPASQAAERFVSVGMFSCGVDAEHSSLPAFLSAPGRSLKAAPELLSAAMGDRLISGLLVGRDVGGEEEEEEEAVWEEEGEEVAEEQCGLAHRGDAAFLEDGRHTAEGEDERSRASRAHSKGTGVLESKDGDDGAWDGEDEGHTHDGDEEDEDEGQDEEAEDEGVALERVMGRIDNLNSERDELAALNADLQRKVSALIAREKALLQGQSRAGSAPEDLQKEEEAPKEEHVQEKEKQFSEILLHVVDARKKASQQQLEYDQLALDLQTRLDDREFKAGEIYESFRAFKKEILLKAENSRTSKPMSKRLIKQFEAAEAKREEDLERVRLRNISMRTQLKKMEKTLRAREQLAEGLYMIDFEQLKVENQTLYEKIEERSEELGKLKRKKTTTVQMLTHVREKLRFIENVRPPPICIWVFQFHPTTPPPSHLNSYNYSLPPPATGQHPPKPGLGTC